MRPKSASLLVTLELLIAFSFLFLPEIHGSYSITYQLLNHPDGHRHFSLNIVVSESLHEYYVEKTHGAAHIRDFAQFVTPYALEPIADRLWDIYVDDEDFANGVLMIVHQIPYQETANPKYPVETMVGNEGDCDLFSFVAASIIMAGDLDVVLLYYESEAHMNIGVRLSHEPDDARQEISYVTYDNKRYYVAECTGGDWQSGWRVGECPTSLEQASVQVITLENHEQVAPGQVSASYKALEASTISMDVSPTFLIEGGQVVLSGQILPALQNETITIYIKTMNLPWTVQETSVTDFGGEFIYVWNTQVSGICYVRASWSGNDEYAAADSPTRTLTILPTLLVLLLTITAISICLAVVVSFMSSKTSQEIQPSESPEAYY